MEAPALTYYRRDHYMQVGRWVLKNLLTGVTILQSNHLNFRTTSYSINMDSM